VGIIAWIVAVLILIALIVYGLMELIQGGSGTSPTPSTTSTTPTTATTTPTPTTTQSSETPTSSAVEPPAQQPTQQPTHQPTQQQPTHRHHLPQLPSVITIPDGPVLTLPPGLS
jgi:cytoskeletal protein RodZ